MNTNGDNRGKLSVEVRSLGSSAAEATVLRNGQPVAVLSEKHPLWILFRLSVTELRSVRRELTLTLRDEARIRDIVDAIIEYKAQDPSSGDGDGAADA